MIRSDIAIIGAGPAGYTAALRARQLGAEVVCIERDKIGGVCLNWGCIPTKALLRSAEIYELMQEASRFGVLVQEAGFDWAQIQARKQEVVDQMVGGITLLMDRAGVQMVQGTATLAFAVREIINKEADAKPQRVKAIYGRFTGMVRPGTEIRVVLTHKSIQTDESQLFFSVFNDTDEKAIKDGCLTLAHPHQLQ